MKSEIFESKQGGAFDTLTIRFYPVLRIFHEKSLILRNYVLVKLCYAISKAQNCKRDPLGFVKLQLVSKYFKKMKGDPLGTLKISQKNFNEIFEVSQCRKM